MFETLDDLRQNEEPGPETEDDAKATEPASFEGPSTLLFIFAGALLLVSLYFGNIRRMTAFTLITYFAVAAFALGVFWPMRNRVRFWITFAAMVSLHVLLALSSPLSDWWLHGKNMVVVDFVDFLAYLAGISIVDKAAGSFKRLRK